MLNRYSAHLKVRMYRSKWCSMWCSCNSRQSVRLNSEHMFVLHLKEMQIKSKGGYLQRWVVQSFCKNCKHKWQTWDLREKQTQKPKIIRDADHVHNSSSHLSPIAFLPNINVSIAKKFELGLKSILSLLLSFPPLKKIVSLTKISTIMKKILILIKILSQKNKVEVPVG